VAEAPDTPERAILRAPSGWDHEAAAETAFHRLLMDLGGWAQHARWLLVAGRTEWRNRHTLADLLAIRLIWEEALLAHVPEVEALAPTSPPMPRPVEPTPTR
jgi:uncharacterized protein YbcC (UPF0753/DUF2309 family)